jgi:ubiquinone/menaquinone biosynthesis C-methylase UbiE
MTGNSRINIAGWYDPIFEGMLGSLRTMAARVVPPRAGMKVLDIGCGTGAQLSIYQDGMCQVFGIDLSYPMLRVAKSKLGDQAVLSMGDALNLPCPDGQFDLVISSLFIHQLNPDLRPVMLQEAARVIKPGGQIMIIDFHNQDGRSFLGKLTYAFIRGIEFFAGWEHFSNSRDFLSRGVLPRLAQDLGLMIRKTFLAGNGNLGIYLLRLE